MRHKIEDDKSGEREMEVGKIIRELDEDENEGSGKE